MCRLNADVAIFLLEDVGFLLYILLILKKGRNIYLQIKKSATKFKSWSGHGRTNRTGSAGPEIPDTFQSTWLKTWQSICLSYVVMTQDTNYWCLAKEKFLRPDGRWMSGCQSRHRRFLRAWPSASLSLQPRRVPRRPQARPKSSCTCSGCWPQVLPGKI